ncbi:MAG: hypothetical protein GXP26_18420 [Planctomycetes bacterium]|nr:hypothetical protein [Planctomycetota bacterium]
MTFSKPCHSSRCPLMLAAFSFIGMLVVASSGAGQESADNSSLAQQLQELQVKVANLEAALKKNHQAPAMADKSAMKMGGMQGGMPMKGKMSGMGMSSMSGMGMMGGGGMAMMGQMKGMGQMQMATALPGFAGASHIYHIGSTNFFLDHPQHITLSQEQQTKLNQIKEKSLLGQATIDRWVAEAEQELWVLTSSDVPDATKIEAKVREAEKLRGDKRVAFIRAVGEAAQVLTDEQRQTLVGLLPPDHSATGVGDPN